MNTVVTNNGQIVLPLELRQQDQIQSGQQFEIERLEPGRYLLTMQPRPDNEGLVNWLLACPDKNWFQAIDSESTETL